MPESAAAYTNGHADGVGVRECEDMETFLFTSESVGEGHPGKEKGEGGSVACCVLVISAHSVSVLLFSRSITCLRISLEWFPGKG